MEEHHIHEACIEACLRCAAICNHCASSCTREADVQMMAKCIRLDMECAAVCYAAGQLLSLGSSHAHEICRICAATCLECAEECANHDEPHCQLCAATCRACAEECNKMAA